MKSEPIALVEHCSCELITEWEGPDLEIGQTIIVTEMDTINNKISCRVLEVNDDCVRVEITQGRLIAISKDEDDQPPAYFAEPTERGPLISLA